MILCDKELLAALDSKALIIDPRPPSAHVTTTAIDLTLHDEFKRWKEPKSGVTVTLDPSTPDFHFPTIANEYLEVVSPDSDGALLLKPRNFILAKTREWVEFPIGSRLGARVEGRSSLARLGLGVHVTAPTIHSDFRGFITLELHNWGTLPIKLKPGLRICQLIVEQVFGTPGQGMKGVFQDQKSVTGR